MTAQSLLAGLKVIEIAEGIAGPMAGKVLIDLGASVTRIEQPGGDWLQALAAEGETSEAYRQLNADKHLLSIDLKTAAGQAQLDALVAEADIAIRGVRRAKLAGLGLAPERLRGITPGLILCYISGWGSTGPMADMAASELAVQVACGLTRYLGTPDTPPVRQGFDLVAVDTGLAAVQAVLAALLWRQHSGQGQLVEVSMLETAIALMQWDTTAFSGPERWEGRQLNGHLGPSDHGYECADARCLIDMRSNEEAWPSLLCDLGCHDLAADPRFATAAALDLHVTKLPALTAPVMRHWAFADLEKLVRDKYDGIIVPMLDLAQAVAHPQVRHIGVIIEGTPRRIRFPMDVV